MKNHKKIKHRKYNKLLSYNKMDRAKRNFFYKDFSYSISLQTRFTGSKFYGNNFYRASMKYCGFNNCKFESIEFKSVNFRGSRFKGAVFDNVIFNNCNLENADFTNAIFKNVFYTNTNIRKAKGINNPDMLKRVNNNSLKINIGEELSNAITKCKQNDFIRKSETLFYRKKNRMSNAKKRELKEMTKAKRREYQRNLKQPQVILLNKVNLMRLLIQYKEDEVAHGLILASNSIDKEFSTLSYFVPYIKKATKKE